MTRAAALVWTAVAMLAFAANSLLCRLALHRTDIDAATFTALRLASGGLVLWLLMTWDCPPAAFVPALVVLTLLLSAAAYHGVEAPGIALGRFVEARLFAPDGVLGYSLRRLMAAWLAPGEPRSRQKEIRSNAPGRAAEPAEQLEVDFVPGRSRQTS